MESAYLGTYDDDVFISYAHIDNQPFGVDQQPWINYLHEMLSIRLEQYLGSSASVWRDARLAGNDVLEKEIFERISKCALMVSVCSPRYVSSEWCPRELDAFAEEHGFEAGPKSRLFKVLKTPIDLDRLPPPLQTSVGYQFFEQDPSGRIREFLLEPPDQWWRFFAVVDDLAQDIANTLHALEASGAAPPDAEPADATTVYVALTSSDMTATRDDLRRDLERRGHRVLPEVGLPLTAEEAAEQIRSDLAEATISIHPLGSRYGARPEGERRSYPHLQLDAASDRARDGTLQQVIWVPPGLEPVDEEQTALVNHCEQGRLARQTEYLVSSVEDLKTVVNGHLEAPRQPPTTAAPVSADALVYLVFDQADRNDAERVARYLEDAGCVVLLPEPTGDVSAARLAHQEAMVVCEGVLIYQGHATDQWLTMTLRDLVKARGWGRSEPFDAKAVFLGPPATDAKAGFASALADVVTAVDGSLSPLDTYIEQLVGKPAPV